MHFFKASLKLDTFFSHIVKARGKDNGFPQTPVKARDEPRKVGTGFRKQVKNQQKSDETRKVADFSDKLKSQQKRNQQRSQLTALAIGGLTAVLLALGSQPTHAQEAATQTAPIVVASTPIPKELVRINDMNTGGLLFQTEHEGHYVEAPRLATDVVMDISGPIARVKVTQRFENVTDGWVEGIYVFPLPHQSAVDTLRMQIGDRFIEGEIKEKQEARVIYEQAKREGKKASLLEQQRPNLFTNSVANIGPGETVIVQIHYQQDVRQQANEFSLRFPLVFTPRYNPKPVVVRHDNVDGQTGWSVQDPVPDREEITASVLDPTKNDKINPVTLKVNLQPGFKLEGVKSHHHAVVETETDQGMTLTLKEKFVPADRDFELTWTSAKGAMPTAGLFTETTEKGAHLLAYVMPPNMDTSNLARPPRELIFVIDNSGSMGGQSMRQAKQSLQYALGLLDKRDRFNVIRFDDTMDQLFVDAVAADAENIGQARRFVGALNAEGGTEMLPAMRAALIDRQPNDTNYLRQVVFLTDGAIGNEEQLFNEVVQNKGRSRIFTVGIGSAPNSFFMARAAELGRGTFTHIGTESQVNERMQELFNKLANPVATNLKITYSGGNLELAPNPLPDLYKGEPIVVTARGDTLEGDLTFTGIFNNQPFEITLPISSAAQGPGVGKVWAKKLIEQTEADKTITQDYQAADAKILKTALDYHLVSRLTSLVAVDKEPSRNPEDPLESTKLPLNAPAGWEFEAVTESADVAAAPAPASVARARQLSQNFAVAAPQAPQQQLKNAVKKVLLPEAATPAQLLMMLGGLIVILSLGLFYIARRKRWLV